MTETELLDRYDFLCAKLDGTTSLQIGDYLSARKECDLNMLILFDREDMDAELYLTRDEFVSLAQWLTGDA